MAVVHCALAAILLALPGLCVDVETEYGTVRGHTIVLDDGKAVNSFKAIPFARPPVDDLRFEPPQKPDPWDEVFVADSLGLQCPQNPVGLLWLTHPGWIFYGEDCLNLNIVTPEDMDDGPYPVMVWFHGGGYTGGGNIQYPGHFLASQGVIVVVPNYRLGVFGFLASPEGTLRGNAGMHDQVMALQFVQDNIANFGGDPNRVTIFGQSAGASSAGLHIVSPLSQGLFQQAIHESGADTNFWAANWPVQSPLEYFHQTTANNECDGEETEAAQVACLREVPFNQLRQNGGITCTPGHFCQGYAPIVDGEGGFLPDHPINIRNSSAFVQGNIISGITRDDGSFYTLGLIPEADEGDGFTREEFLFYLEDRLMSIWSPQMDEATAELALRAVDFYYTPWADIEDLGNNREAFNRMITDAAFGLSMERQVKMHYSYANTYMYIQGYRSPNATSFLPEWMGVPHNGELPYVWGWPRLLHNPDVREDQAMFFDIVGWVDPIDIDYTHYVQEMWANFARVGDPTPDPVAAPGDNEPTVWPAYDLDTQQYLDIDDDINILSEYRPRDLAFWREYMTGLTGLPIRAGRGEKGMSSDVFEKAVTMMTQKALLDRMTASEFDDLVEQMKTIVEK